MIMSIRAELSMMLIFCDSSVYFNFIKAFLAF